ncbi:MAG TPA: hypothetical protein VNL94_09260, partial [Candidatus Binatia bacterium]|nr:hypothetical protein [Candidatus Binatia bacterium]
CSAVAADDAFVLLTAHTTGIDGEDLRAALEDAFRPMVAIDVRSLRLEAASGARMDLGWAARFDGATR